MPSNPFAPPNAAVADVLPEHDIRKPLSVWLMQAVAALIACGVAVALVALFANMARYSEGIAGWQLGVFVRLAILCGVVVLALFTIVGSQTRVPGARWAALALMALVLVFDAVFIYFLADWLPGTGASFRMAGGDVAGLLGVAASMCLALGLACACCFSARTRAWFA